MKTYEDHAKSVNNVNTMEKDKVASSSAFCTRGPLFGPYPYCSVPADTPTAGPCHLRLQNDSSGVTDQKSMKGP